MEGWIVGYNGGNDTDSKRMTWWMAVKGRRVKLMQG